jgi:hypothetical protein
MSNTAAVQVTVDSARNVVAKVLIECTSADLGSTTLLDPATLAATVPVTNQLRLDEVQFAVEDGWFVTLYWDATSPVKIVDLIGRGKFPVGLDYGGLQNNAGSGKTGKILATTTGYSTGTMGATLIMHAVKQTV